MEKRLIKVTINGKLRELFVKSNDLLLNVLRNDLNLMGTKYGCGIGECGACTVLLDGQTVLACLILAVTVDGQEITTIEGMGDPVQLHPLQESFIEHGAVQCGFCTPGMLLAGEALLKENPNPSEEEIREYLRGNLCRCTGYAAIVKAIKSEAKSQSADPGTLSE
ncbi:(2Fe-2S)-binding protein [Desulfosporosinus sp. HMP52]|uniref:(2Fe-2S)-binding protein n=1 Tax=Desulfosporosinus sp. HMP52 TaxID=1487923 RepID=UPI00051FDDEF|nr:(2Fe-2S)-binding protein [Desulfosporosinus sp. HMP52]KGK91467.1 (2Fe-2S)-binding protein [Desulfosporosinus sp. HMP52]